MFLFPLGVLAQKPQCDCYKVYTGKFYTEQESGDSVIVEREKTKQIEYVSSDPRNKLKLNVIWLNDCKYILRDVGNSSWKAKIQDGDVIAEIIETGEGYYKVRAWEKKGKKMEVTLHVYPK